MNADDLFLATLDDLDARLELGRGEYDALCMAWLLRRLVFGGERSLVSKVNAERGLELVFAVRDDIRAEGVAGWYPLAPLAAPAPTNGNSFSSSNGTTATTRKLPLEEDA